MDSTEVPIWFFPQDALLEDGWQLPSSWEDLLYSIKEILPRMSGRGGGGA